MERRARINRCRQWALSFFFFSSPLRVLTCSVNYSRREKKKKKSRRGGGRCVCRRWCVSTSWLRPISHTLCFPGYRRWRLKTAPTKWDAPSSMWSVVRSGFSVKQMRDVSAVFKKGPKSFRLVATFFVAFKNRTMIHSMTLCLSNQRRLDKFVASNCCTPIFMLAN